MFKSSWSKGEERGPACDSSWLLRDGPSSARPSCTSSHGPAYPVPTHPFHKERTEEQEAQGRLEQDLPPKQHQTLAQPLKVPLQHHPCSLPSCKLLPMLTSCSSSPCPSSSPTGEFPLFRRDLYRQLQSEKPMDH